MVSLSNKRSNTRDALKSELNNWLGVNFSLGSSSIAEGCDCVGLVIGLAAKMDFHLSRLEIVELSQYWYRPWVSLRNLDKICTKYLCATNRDKIDVGDIVLLKVKQVFGHLAVVYSVEPFIMIHACNIANAVVRLNVDEYVSRNIYKIFAFHELNTRN